MLFHIERIYVIGINKRYINKRNENQELSRYSVHSIKYQTYKICIASIKRDKSIFPAIKRVTFKMWILVLTLHPYLVRHIDRSCMSNRLYRKICETANKKNKDISLYLRDQLNPDYLTINYINHAL